MPEASLICLLRRSGLINSIPYKGVMAREDARPLVAPEPPPGIRLNSLFLRIFYSLEIPTLSFPDAIPIIPRPLPDSLYSIYASAPKGTIFCIFRVMVIWYFKRMLRNFLPPRFFLIFSSGLGRAFLNFGYWGAIILSKRYKIPSRSFFPSLPSAQVPQASIRAARAVLVASIRMICIPNFGGAPSAKSTS